MRCAGGGGSYVHLCLILSSVHSVTSPGEPEVSHGGSTYTPEIAQKLQIKASPHTNREEVYQLTMAT